MTAKTQQVGIREFREHLASYLLQSTAPVAITRHGDTIGYYLPVPRKRTAVERASLKRNAAKLQKEMEAAGLTEEDIVRDFKEWRAAKRK